MMRRMFFARELHISGEGIKIYICIFRNANKIRREVKLVIKSDSQWLFFSVISSSNVVTLSVWSSSLTPKSIKENLSGLRTKKSLSNQFHKMVKSWFNEVTWLVIFFMVASGTRMHWRNWDMLEFFLVLGFVLVIWEISNLYWDVLGKFCFDKEKKLI